MVAIVKKKSEDATKSIQKDIMKDRSETDKYWFYFFVIIYMIWLTMCGYIRLIKDDLQTLPNNGCMINPYGATELEDFIASSFLNIVRIDEHVRSCGTIVAYLNLTLYSSLLMFATFAIFFRVYDKYCGHCLFICLGMQSVSLIYRTLMYVNHDPIRSVIPWEDRFMCWTVPELIAFLICLTLTLVVAMCKGMNAMSNDIKKAIRFYHIHMISLTFGLVILLLMAVLICFTMGTIKGIGTKNISLTIPITILICCLYLLMLLYYFAVAVISLTTANNYWMHSDKKVTWEDLSRSISLIGRYHFGTICFNATAILPLVVASFALFKSVFQTCRARSGFSKKYIMVAFFFFIGEYSTIITATSGKNFYNAADRFIHFPIEARRLAKHLRENQMIWMIIGLIMISVNNIFLIFKWMYFEDDPFFTETTLFSYAAIIYLFMPIALIIDIVMDTIQFCNVEKNEAINKETADAAVVELPTEVAIAK